MSVTTADDDTTLVKCHAGCSQDTVIAALVALRLWSAPRNGSKPRKKPTHVVKDTNGLVVALHERKGPWLHPDGRPSKNGEIKPALQPLYGVEHLADLEDGDEVVVVEGEKTADALRSRGVSVVATYGTSAMPCDDSLRPLLRLKIKLWADNDTKGTEHMAEIAHALHRLGHGNVGRVEWPDAPHKGDAADFPDDDDALRALLGSAVKWEPTPAGDLAEMLDEVSALVRKYVVVTLIQMVAITLWIAHTHAIEAADATPYLNIWSPEKRSGKTRLLEVLRRLVARPWLTARTSPAALYRRVEAESPTFLSDESDAAFKSGDEYSETLRGILNSGFERGGSTTVCVGQGKDITYKEFSTFCPKAIAGIGRLPDTIADRSIPIAMRRQTPGERAAKLRRRAVTREAEPIRERLAQWALAAIPLLLETEPAIPDELDDRAADGWEPLLAIADLAGAGWPDRAREAALALSVGDAREDESLGVRLLRDIRHVFNERDAKQITIADLVRDLIAIEDAPWGEITRGKPLSTRGLGWRLRQYQIKAKTVRFDSDSTARGYSAEWFEDAWARYIPEDSATTDTTDTAGRHEVPVVTNVPLSQEGCAVCGSAEVDGLTPEGEPRCFGHFVKETDSEMVRAAVEQLGLPIVARRKVEHP